ncbi:hypothetical protein JCM8547_003303 [Rhodosporidiobolus lusitaniae]
MDESPLIFVERWTDELRTLQASFVAKLMPAGGTSEEVQKLAQQLTARTGDIPSSELARCQRELKSLQDTLAASKTIAAPKSKFSFKRSTPAASSSSAKPMASLPPPMPVLSSSTPSPVPASASTVPSDALSFSSRSNAFLSSSDLPSPTSASSAAHSLALSSLTDCVVDLLAPASPSTASTFSAIYLSNLSSSVVLLPSGGSGSILIQNCTNCVFVLSGHQFRMHDSASCSVFLQAGSTPIIERCRELADAPPPSPPKPPQDFDDPFASPDRPSSNWRFVSEAESTSPWADETWPAAEKRREGWKELLEAALPKNAQ